MTYHAIKCRHGELNPQEQTIIMGVLNVTPDSFSDGGRFLTESAIINQTKHLIEKGAQIIDIGGESTRPFSEPVPLEEELSRVIPAIKAVRSFSDIPISIDTTKAEVAQRALEEGADIINDISALRFDKEMADLAASTKVPVILMHMKGTPQDMQVDPVYEDVMKEILDFFQERINFCKERGIDTNQIIIDPGIGFGKRFQDNLDIINQLSKLSVLRRPILIGPSRKAFLGKITGHETPELRDNATCGAAVAAVLNGASIVRVHEPGCVADALKVAHALRQRKGKCK
ncbi:MAG: dihydropteroate synthase [Thermodesulfobacteria bacterium]|nr:dihydropteroate synthase [Thermodesulfobacteriota bacterium]